MGTLRKYGLVGVTCWKLKSHLFKALVVPTFTNEIKSWGSDLKNLTGTFSKKGDEDTYDFSHQSVFFKKT
jgi:hypothetical protein